MLLLSFNIVRQPVINKITSKLCVLW